jgi:hypothetical protein
MAFQKLCGCFTFSFLLAEHFRQILQQFFQEGINFTAENGFGQALFSIEPLNEVMQTGFPLQLMFAVPTGKAINNGYANTESTKGAQTNNRH